MKRFVEGEDRRQGVCESSRSAVQGAVSQDLSAELNRRDREISRLRDDPGIGPVYAKKMVKAEPRKPPTRQQYRIGQTRSLALERLDLPWRLSLGSDPAEDSKTIRPLSPPPCSRTRSSTSPIAATSSSTHSSAPARPSSPPRLPAASSRGRARPALRRRDHTALRGGHNDPAVLVETGEAFQALGARRGREAAPV